jgi:1-acyl-sn-glycerol-3-phosphate acyltransferase
MPAPTLQTPDEVPPSRFAAHTAAIIDDPALPKTSAWLCRWFSWYCVRYSRKHFHAVRLSRTSHPVVANGQPLLFVMNHPSWWDIIVGVVLCGRFPAYRHFAPIDAAMLPKYRFFARLGFFGVEPTPRGGARFLRTARALFDRPFRAMWVTAQGKFVDPRVRPIELRPGVGHVASRLSDGFLVPVAVEYLFWDERTPEALVRFGEPLELATANGIDGREWTARIEAALTATQDALAAEAMRRDPALFESIVAGKTGVGGPYDWWRRCRAWLRGQKFDPAHASAGPGAETEGGLIPTRSVSEGVHLSTETSAETEGRPA